MGMQRVVLCTAPSYSKATVSLTLAWCWIKNFFFDDEALNYFQFPFSHLYHGPRKKTLCRSLVHVQGSERVKLRVVFLYPRNSTSFLSYAIDRLDPDTVLLMYNSAGCVSEVVWSIGVSAKLLWLNHLVNLLVTNISRCWYWDSPPVTLVKVVFSLPIIEYIQHRPTWLDGCGGRTNCCHL